METKEHLTTQRDMFKMFQTKMHDMTNKFPMINSLVSRANLRKRRDTIILALVTSICIILLILYTFY